MYVFTLAILLGFPPIMDSYAQESSGQSVDKLQEEKKPTFWGELKYRHYGRLNSPLHENPETGFFAFKAAHSSREKRLLKNYGHRFNTEFRFNLDKSYLLTSFREAYLERSFKQTTYGLGRKILSWNPNERYWVYGTLNSVQGFSPLEPKQEGLTGFHVTHKRKHFLGEFFASYFFIPQYNPSYYSDTQTGRIIGRTEWAPIVSTHFRLNNVFAPIFYKQVYPSNNQILKDFVLNESFGLQAAYRYGENGKTGKVALYGAYKPENQVRKYLYGLYHQNPKEMFVADVKAFVNYHLLLGLGFSHRQGPWVLSGAAEHSRPEPGYLRFSSPDFFEIHEPYFKDMRYTSSLVFQSSFWKLGLHYLNVQNERKRHQRYFLDKVYEWHHTLGFSLEYLSENHWQGVADYKYDFRYRDATFKSEIKLTRWMPLQVAFGLETVRSPLINGHWHSFATNDSAYSYISYVF